jgi:DNA-binding response OmpR family regulator
MKRLLLFTDNPQVLNFYREKFEAAGVSVETARSRETAEKLLSDKVVDLAVADPVVAGSSAVEIIKSLRASLGEKPLLVFPQLPAALSAAMMQAGATAQISRSGKTAPEAASEATAALALLPVNPFAPSDIVNEAWLKSILDSAPDTINAMRSSLHAFVKNTSNVDALYAVFCEVHHLSERTAMIGLQPVSKMASAIGALVHDLYTMPEQVNPSVLRTISQSIDLLTALLEEKNVQRVQDPSISEVFVVDDEADARKLVSAAMNMVHVKITCAADADMALAVLEDNSFSLIFLDINLQQADAGFDLCAKVRQIEDHRKTPIVFLTGLATFQNRAKSSLSGGNDFVGKPFNLLELSVKALTWIFKGQLALV